eukprot:358287-Chlamydomonas_euryale.AAC.16
MLPQLPLRPSLFRAFVPVLSCDSPHSSALLEAHTDCETQATPCPLLRCMEKARGPALTPPRQASPAAPSRIAAVSRHCSEFRKQPQSPECAANVGGWDEQRSQAATFRDGLPPHLEFPLRLIAATMTVRVPFLRRRTGIERVNEGERLAQAQHHILLSELQRPQTQHWARPLTYPSKLKITPSYVVFRRLRTRKTDRQFRQWRKRKRVLLNKPNAAAANKP